MGKFGFFDRFRIPTYNDPTQMQFGIVEIDVEKCTGCGLCAGACPAKCTCHGRQESADEKSAGKCMRLLRRLCGDLPCQGRSSMKKPLSVLQGFTRRSIRGDKPSPALMRLAAIE